MSDDAFFLVVTRGVARALAPHLDDALVGTQQIGRGKLFCDQIRDIAAKPDEGCTPDGIPWKRGPHIIEVRSGELDAWVARDALSLAMRDPVNPPNLKSALRRRFVEVSTRLFGKDIVTLLAEMDG